MIKPSIILCLTLLTSLPCATAGESWQGSVLKYRDILPPFSGHWTISRTIYKDDQKTAHLGTHFDEKIAEADRKGDSSEAAQLKRMRDSMAAQFATDQQIYMRVDVDYAKEGKFVAAQTFINPDSVTAFRHHGVGPLVYTVFDQGQSIEITPRSRKHLQELLRGNVAWGIGAALDVSAQGNPVVSTKGNLVTVWVRYHEMAWQEIDFAADSKMPVGLRAWVMGSMTYCISSAGAHPFHGLSLPESVTYQNFDESGRKVSEETWKLERITDLANAAEFDSSFEFPKGYEVRDQTGPEPVVKMSDDFIKKPGE